MNIVDKNIDSGKAFDWGRTSDDYAKYRDIYPKEFYEKIVNRSLCISGQRVLDLGTGTGVLPRNMYQYGAKWVGTDISENQINKARLMSAGKNIEYYTMPAENLSFPDNSFDVITACQCFFYFNHEKLMPALHRILKADGRILIMYMAWLPFDDKIAGESEKLVLKYNPNWSGAGETRHPINIPECYNEGFELVFREEYPLNVHFTRESWNGRMKACRGVGASLTESEIADWEREHIALLERIAQEEFDVLHYAAIAEVKKKI
ncbi:MAG: class I SAM-dependent methyltransferase [Lachnospiraceae bacterium]